MKLLKIDILTPFQKVFEDIIASLPILVGFLGFILFAWIFIKLFIWVVKKVLVKTNVDRFSEKLSETKIFGNTTINIILTNVITEVLKWFLILIFVMAGASIFGLEAVSSGIKSFFAYLPRLITALFIFAVGVYLGTVIKNATQNVFKSLEINGGNLVGNIAFYLIVIFLSITALDQAGIDTSIIKQNVTLIIGSILLAFTIAFGLGARDAVTRLLYGYYSRKNIEIGATIKINDIEGKVIMIDNICVTLLVEGASVVFPIKHVVDTIVVIKK